MIGWRRLLVALGIMPDDRGPAHDPMPPQDRARVDAHTRRLERQAAALRELAELRARRER